MTDITERAEAALRLYELENGRGDEYRYKTALIRDLLTALKAERDEKERLLGIIESIGWPQ